MSVTGVVLIARQAGKHLVKLIAVVTYKFL
jgi:hypothetical protein